MPRQSDDRHPYVATLQEALAGFSVDQLKTPDAAPAASPQLGPDLGQFGRCPAPGMERPIVISPRR